MDMQLQKILEGLNDANAREQAVIQYCSQALARRFSSIQPVPLAWSEEAFSAQIRYQNLNKRQILERWLSMAEENLLHAEMDPARGLQVRELP